MFVRRPWVSVHALLLCACGSTATPLPTISSVEPASMPADSRYLLTVNLDGPLPVHLDYGGDSGQVSVPLRVSLNDKSFDLLQTEDHGRRLTLDIIPWLPVGAQDLRVELQDGRQVVLAQGFQVKPPLNLTGFSIDPIGSQVRGQPFTVTIHAQGPDAALFAGRLIIRSTQGNVNPKVSDAFQAGVLQQQLVGEDSTQSTLSIIVEDYAGHTGSSNDFILARP